MTRLVEIMVNGKTYGRELAEFERHYLLPECSRITYADLVRDVPLADLAQIFVDGQEVWRNPDATIAEAVEQGRVHTLVATDAVKIRDQAG